LAEESSQLRDVAEKMLHVQQNICRSDETENVPIQIHTMGGNQEAVAKKTSQKVKRTYSVTYIDIYLYRVTKRKLQPQKSIGYVKPKILSSNFYPPQIFVILAFEVVAILV